MQLRLKICWMQRDKIYGQRVFPLSVSCFLWYIHFGGGLSIKEEKQNNIKKIKLKQEYNIVSNGQTLLEYCVENSLNYTFIYRAINTYGKTLEEAVREYKEKGSKMPNKWIFEKYGVLKYLEIGFKLLSTTGDKYIVSDIDIFIDARK